MVFVKCGSETQHAGSQTERFHPKADAAPAALWQVINLVDFVKCGSETRHAGSQTEKFHPEPDSAPAPPDRSVSIIDFIGLAS